MKFINKILGGFFSKKGTPEASSGSDTPHGNAASAVPQSARPQRRPRNVPGLVSFGDALPDNFPVSDTPKAEAAPAVTPVVPQTPAQPETPAAPPVKKPSFVGKAPDENAFYAWLHASPEIPPSLCQNYVSAIRLIEEFAVAHHYPHSNLYGSTAGKVIPLVEKLLQDEEFIAYDEQKDNFLRKALDKLLQLAEKNSLGSAEPFLCR